ncbi:MAG TPA: 2-hydroxyacid dehydrogenase [Rariglobus sp.]|jgi:D-lactate dehydrogenase|nr:2-hydroxyacid dehydrogenase [Rariglobus sp.]
MNIAVFSAKSYDREYLGTANSVSKHRLIFCDTRLMADTVALAEGCEVVCAFVNDRLDAEVVTLLAKGGTRLIAMRCAGYNNVDLYAAASHGVTVVNVPSYSPHAVAEHAVALLLTLNRRIHQAYARVLRGDFALDGLIGFDLCGKTVGLVGTGRIGTITGQILQGFGCRVLASDPFATAEARKAGFTFCDLDELLAQSDIVSLHCPLTPATRHIINADRLARMKRGATLLNTSRGGLIDTPAVIDALESGQLGRLGLDVYENEACFFYDDHSERPLPDQTLAHLISLPNVLLTGHQGFLTHEALTNIAETTFRSIDDFSSGRPCGNALRPV